MSEAVAQKEWKTAITRVEPNKITVHGYAIDEMMGKISFAEGLYLILRGELPPANAGKLMDAILVSSVDHGVTPPSVPAALTSASTGANLSQAMACAILSINQFHGGAIENCQKALYEGAKMMKEEGITPEEAGERIVAQSMASKKTLFGLGHRVHTKDPRTARLFEIAREAGLYGDYCRMIQGMAAAFEKAKGKSLPVNVDVAVAAALCEMDFPAEMGNAFFMIARMPGILAHYNEEKKRQKTMRRICPNDYEYDGPGYRPLER
jgi:citrate synthase